MWIVSSMYWKELVLVYPSFYLGFFLDDDNTCTFFIITMKAQNLSQLNTFKNSLLQKQFCTQVNRFTFSWGIKNDKYLYGGLKNICMKVLLGIIIDEKRKFDSHVKTVCKEQLNSLIVIEKILKELIVKHFKMTLRSKHI